MPLPKNLEDLLKHMEPAAAKVQRELWEANPAIADAVDKGTIPRAEFSRQLNEKDEEVKKANKLSIEWKEWSDKHKPIHSKLIEDHANLERENAELKKRIESAGDKTGSVVTDDLVDNVTKRLEGRVVSDSVMRAVVKEEAAALKKSVDETLANAEKRFFEETLPNSLQWQSGMIEAQMRYKEEWGKPIDKAAFGKFMQDNKITDPNVAYERFTEADRRAKEIKAEVDKQVAAEKAKLSFPGVTGGEPTGEKGYLQLRIEGDPAKHVAPTGELGDRSAAVAAATELRQEGAF